MKQVSRRAFVQGFSGFAAVLGAGLSVGLKVKPETPTTSRGIYISQDIPLTSYVSVDGTLHHIDPVLADRQLGFA